MRTVFFPVKLRTFRGSHLKLWDYFGHVCSAPGFTARVAFEGQTSWDDSNPWRDAREYVVDDWRALAVDAFFIGGRRWELAEYHPNWGPRTPVINLIQHVHHAEEDNERFQYLSRPAIRICVSEEVREALRETGVAREPLIVIPNGIDLSDVLAQRNEPAEVDVLIAALKRPDLGRQLAERLQAPGRRVRLLTEFLHRPDYLREIERARVTAFLPNDTEGFYLPALEGLAAGTLVVCPDCVGNRSFCLPGYNAFRPSFAIDEIAGAVEAALALPEREAADMRLNAEETVARFTLRQERSAMHEVLANLDALWREALPPKERRRRERKEARQAERQAARAQQGKGRGRSGEGRAQRAEAPAPATEEKPQRGKRRERASGERPAAGKGRDGSEAEAGAWQERRKLKVQRLKLGESHYAQPPDYIITGAQQGGTTGLVRLLAKHPEVGEVLRKEIHFFSRSYEKGMPWYLSHFPEPGDFAVVGEASTSYLSDPEVPGRILRDLPDVKLIAMLRNPIDRAYAHYQMNVNTGNESLSFEEAIAREPERLAASPNPASTGWRHASYLVRGHYAEQLRRWLAAFPREQLLIVQSEAFFASPLSVWIKLLEFLELPPHELNEFRLHDQESNADMAPATRAKLAAYFAPLNRELYDLLRHTFDWDGA